MGCLLRPLAGPHAAPRYCRPPMGRARPPRRGAGGPRCAQQACWVLQKTPLGARSPAETVELSLARLQGSSGRSEGACAQRQAASWLNAPDQDVGVELHAAYGHLRGQGGRMGVMEGRPGPLASQGARTSDWRRAARMWMGPDIAPHQGIATNPPESSQEPVRGAQGPNCRTMYRSALLCSETNPAFSSCTSALIHLHSGLACTNAFPTRHPCQAPPHNRATRALLNTCRG